MSYSWQAHHRQLNIIHHVYVGFFLHLCLPPVSLSPVEVWRERPAIVKRPLMSSAGSLRASWSLIDFVRRSTAALTHWTHFRLQQMRRMLSQSRRGPSWMWNKPWLWRCPSRQWSSRDLRRAACSWSRMLNWAAGRNCSVSPPPERAGKLPWRSLLPF